LYPLTEDEWVYTLYYKANPERMPVHDTIRSEDRGKWFYLAPPGFLKMCRIEASRPIGFYRFNPLPAGSPYINESPSLKATRFLDLSA
jgi:hypothetical protein